MAQGNFTPTVARYGKTSLADWLLTGSTEVQNPGLLTASFRQPTLPTGFCFHPNQTYVH
jgi:hypothetical protein